MVWLWNSEKEEAVQKLVEDSEGTVVSSDLSFSPDASQLASISVSVVPSSEVTLHATVHVWNIGTRTPSIFGSWRCGWSHPSVTFSPNGHFLAAAAGEIERVHIWRTSNGQSLGSLFQTGKESVCFLTFSHDSMSITTGTDDGTLHTWDISSRRLVSVRVDSSPFDHVSDWLGCSSDGRFVARISHTMYQTSQRIRIWDAVTPGVIATACVNPVRKGAATFATDSHSIIIGGDDRIMVWRVEAVCSLAAGPQCDPLSQLMREGLHADGWVRGPSGELLLWVPAEYRQYVQLPPCTLMISKHRVVIATGDAGLHYGDNWTLCWR